MLGMHAIAAHWGELPVREQQIVVLYYYRGMTQAQMGQQVGLSQMHVSRLLARATAGAVGALISAGLVEEAAAHEAVEVLSAAGLIAAAADEVAAEAVAGDAATIWAASITLSEARVLRYLPTPLTFALIAGKLGISRSAAKERAERADKKLGVRSRGEAVMRARPLGLID
jgi:DNA-binding CsgD family transcriptional regulator/predicted DNA-binding protein (UPF0251 family)